MVSLGDIIKRKIEVQRHRIQRERIREGLKMQQAVNEFQIELQCIKQVIEVENPINDHYYISVHHEDDQTFEVLLRIDKITKTTVTEEYIYRGQTVSKEQTTTKEEISAISATRVVWSPLHKQWALKIGTGENHHIDLIGTSEQLLDQLIEMTTQYIAIDQENNAG